MAEKHLVCHGAICKCIFGASPDKLTVKSQKQHFINDKEGSEKLIATNKEIGASVFEKNTFGPCQKQPLPGGGYKPCQAVVQEWSGVYDNVTLSNKGKILLEDSKATCPIGGSDCISITHHGQKGEPSKQQSRKSDDKVMKVTSPIADNKNFKIEDEQDDSNEME
jgi:hypothetical protein